MSRTSLAELRAARLGRWYWAESSAQARQIAAEAGGAAGLLARSELILQRYPDSRGCTAS